MPLKLNTYLCEVNNKEQRHAEPACRQGRLVSASHFRLITSVLLNTTLKQVQGDGQSEKQLFYLNN